MSIAEKLTTLAENVPKVYESGKMSEYKRFWNAFQQNGSRTNYDHAFFGRQWDESILEPIHSISPTTASRMFLNCNYRGDLRQLGVTLDFSNCTTMDNLFGYAFYLTHVGTIDMSSATSIAGMFVDCSSLITIDELIFKADGSQTPGTSIFKNCTSLENIEIGGVIGQDISWQHSTKLSKSSITSIINALSSTVSGKTLTLSKTAVNTAFTTPQWNTLIVPKNNWTILLA